MKVVVVVILNFSHFLSFSPEPLSQFQPNLARSLKHPWVKGIQFYSNKRPCPFTRGYNCKIANMIEPLGQYQPILA